MRLSPPFGPALRPAGFAGTVYTIGKPALGTALDWLCKGVALGWAPAFWAVAADAIAASLKRASARGVLVRNNSTIADCSDSNNSTARFSASSRWFNVLTCWL